MVELDEKLCVVGMECFRQAGDLSDNMCVGHAELVRRADTCFIIDSGDLRNDQSCTASCSISVILDHAGAGFTRHFCKGTSHSGHDDTVAQFKRTDPAGFK